MWRNIARLLTSQIAHTVVVIQYIPYVTNAEMEAADPDPVIAIILSGENEIHSCLQHTVQGEGVHPPPVQGNFLCYM